MVQLRYGELIREVLGEPTTAPEQTATDDRILEAALEVFADHGERLTMEEVASRAGVARKTVFRLFGSKDGLLARLYEREVRDTVQVAVEAADAAGPDIVDALVAVYCRLVERVTASQVARRLSQTNPDAMVRMWREGRPSASAMVCQVLVQVAQRGRTVPLGLEGACALLARQIFMYVLQSCETGRQVVGAQERAAIRGMVVAALARKPTPVRLR